MVLFGGCPGRAPGLGGISVAMLRWRSLGVALALAAGCAHSSKGDPTPTSKVESGPPVKRIKLAVLPVDGEASVKVATALNALLHDVQAPGVDDYFLSKVTLEVVQLAVECVRPTSECYSAVGKSLAAQRLLLGHVSMKGKRR